MRIIIQRVSEAILSVDSKMHTKIGNGLCVLIGIGISDDETDVNWLISKLLQLRIFSDRENKMNLNIEEIEGEILLISQFTLFASTKKGSRPGFSLVAKPEIGEKLYNYFCNQAKDKLPGKIRTGIFGATMQIRLTNEGPVTIIMDSKNRE